MTIKIVRNDAGNCVNFVGTTNPAYWNACLSAEVDSEDPTRINVLNNIRTSDPADPVYEFYKIPYTEFADKDGNAFPDAPTTAAYITENAHVVGASTDGVGSDLTDETVCFSLDDTSTSILLDIGYSYGVNTIKAVPDADGTIHIKAKLGDRTLFSQLAVGSACKADGTVIPGGLNDVVNYLNELFTVGPFEAVVISDPFSTMIADVNGVDAGYTLEGSTAIDPAGTEVYANSTSSNYAGLKSTATIDQAGEYFTFDIRGEGQIGFGLVHSDASFAAGKYSGSATYADPATFAVGNSAHYGYQFSHWFHPTPNGSWTNYGANTAYSMRAGWSNWDQKQDWIDGNPVKIRVGLDVNAYISVESLQDDGSWVVHARTTYPVPQGAEYHLGIKASNASARVYSAPKVHLLEPEAPTMYFRWIESPDGVYHYPLFATEEEANYYDEHNSISTGTGTSHTHTYVDDPTGTTWYMPDNGRIMSGATPPQDAAHLTFEGNPVTYTEVTSLTNGDLVPPVFTYSDISQQEGSAINIQTQPQDTGYATTITGLPNGLTSFSGIIQGTLPEVASDTTYTVTVTRTNSYGSSQGTFDITVTNTAPAQSYTTPWNKALDFSGSSERIQQSNSSVLYTPLKMAGQSSQVALNQTSGYTVANGYPWATACVFKIDGHSSNQHIWNLGEGSGSNDDNIYLRLDSGQRLYFGMGRGNEVNECLIHTLSSAWWYGVYVGFNGARYGAAGSTASRLDDIFTIKLISSIDNFTTLSDPATDLMTGWTHGASSTGARMDREFGGEFTIGGRGSNRSFHGKVASMVSTTLRCNQPMPSDAEILQMIRDPQQWLIDYKAGNPYRRSPVTSDLSNFMTGTYDTAQATQVWLMGDSPQDAFSLIRNYTWTGEYTRTAMFMSSMVSNDIQNVTISGLT